MSHTAVHGHQDGSHGPGDGDPRGEFMILILAFGLLLGIALSFLI